MSELKLWQKYLLYLMRWQLSTPIMAVVFIVLRLFRVVGDILPLIIANIIGGLIFFWVDKFIFRSKTKAPLWEIQNNAICYDCGKTGTCFRIVEWKGYNRRVVKEPQFRCDQCKDAKMQEIAASIK